MHYMMSGKANNSVYSVFIIQYSAQNLVNIHKTFASIHKCVTNVCKQFLYVHNVPFSCTGCISVYNPRYMSTYVSLLVDQKLGAHQLLYTHILVCELMNSLGTCAYQFEELKTYELILKKLKNYE